MGSECLSRSSFKEHPDQPFPKQSDQCLANKHNSQATVCRQGVRRNVSILENQRNSEVRL